MRFFPVFCISRHHRIQPVERRHTTTYAMTNQFIISGLIAKRAKLSGEIGEAEKRVAQLRADLDSLDATIRLFDPSIKPKGIKPRVKRSAKHKVFRNGDLTRVTLSVLRKAEKPLTVRETADLVAAECRLDMSTIRAANVVIANVRAALARPHEGLMAEKLGKEPMVYRVTE